MICGHIEEKGSILYLPKALQRAITFLKENDLAKHELGRFPLEGEDMILQVMDLTTSPRENLRPERHEKYIDVQFLAAGGPEHIGWYPDNGNDVIDEDLLDTPKDICFFKNNSEVKENIINMRPGSYAVFFPWDVHIPAIAVDQPANVRKIVIKVALSLCV